MGAFKTRQIKWTEALRLQLVEAVIKVETELFEELNTVTRSRARGKLKRFVTVDDVWTRITNLLPIELRAKIWSNRLQRFTKYKCRHVFDHLLRSYRDELAGRASFYSKLVMSKPVCELIKRREDLLKARASTRAAEQSLKSGSSDSINYSSAHRQRHHVQEHDTRGVKSSSKKTLWTQTSRLLLINAVIQVEEEESRNGGSKSFKSSCTRRRIGKWERVANLLPPRLRGQTWNSKQQSSSTYKCRYVFQYLVKAYKAMEGSMPNNPRLTEPVHKAMKNREDLLRARTLDGVGMFERCSPDRFSMNNRSKRTHSERQQSSTGNSFLNMQTDQESDSLEDRSEGTSTQPAVTFSSQLANESERKSTSSMNHTEGDEKLHAEMEGLVTRLDLEFSRLSSWVENRSIQLKKTVMEEITSSAMESFMRCEIIARDGGATESFDNLRSFRRMIDRQILASFKDLRTRFTGDLELAREELSEKVLQGTKRYPGGLSRRVGEGPHSFKKGRYH
ncbi:unnamed protein product [Calypogeia fissa]